MPGNGVKVGSLAGIPISVHPLWLVIVALITLSLGSVYYPDQVDGIEPAGAYALGLASALLLFASILLHELGHALVARRHGVEIEGIELWLLGGVARMKGDAGSPGDELRYALAGPAVTVGILLFFAAALGAMPDSAPEALVALLAYQALVNGMILAFNLLPAFPLDGGRVLRALLWGHWDDFRRATATAAAAGRGFGYFLISIGIASLFLGAPGGLWLGVIGVFLIMAGRSEEEGVRLRATFEHLGLRRVMAVPAVTLPADLDLEQALRDFFIPFGYRSFPVLDGDRVVGLLSLTDVEPVPPAARGTTTARAVADADPSLLVGEAITVDELSANPGFARHGRVIVACESGELGILSASAIDRALRASRLLDERPERPERSAAAAAPVPARAPGE